MKKTKADLVRGWILKAESDLKDADRTIHSDGPFDTACFHCQQAAEKLLKAFIAWNDLTIPKTHDIEELVSMIVKIDVDFKHLEIEAEKLSSYGVEVRYDFEFWPDREIAQDAIEQARKIKELVLTKLVGL